MLNHIKVTPLAAESLSVRSMCTYAETSDVKILLDAGVSLCPNRFGLPPHPREYQAIVGCREKIAEAAAKAQVVTLSHYHFDHHTPSYEDWLSQWTEADATARQIYDGKLVLMKNPRDRINSSQRRRGWLFQETGGKYAEKLEVADEKTFTFGNTQVRFSDPVFHGSEDSFLGWVLMTTIECKGERFMFAPDVQGPMSAHTFDTVIREEPQLLMVGGPPSYLAGFKVSEKQLQAGFANLRKLVKLIPTTILDHHVLRDENWKERCTDVFFEAYKSGHTVVTAAEFLEQSNSLLEARRRMFYAADPPSKEFEKWMRTSEEKRRLTRPPI